MQALAPLPLHPARAARHGRSAAGGPYTSPLRQSALAWPQSASRTLDRLCERPESVGGAGVADIAGAGTYPRPRATNSGHFEGSRRRSQHGDWHWADRWMAACTGPSRYSTHKVGLEDMGGPDPPAGWAARFRSAPQLAGCQGSGPPSSRLELWRATPAPQTRPPYRPWSCIARQREQPPREAGCQQVHVHRAGGSCGGWGANTDLLEKDAL